MTSGKFDFTNFLETITSDYIAREYVESTIQNFIDERQCGLCVITGEPGSGKTVLAAANVLAHNFLHYFLRRGHVEFSLWRDPYAFLATVGYQLWDRYGDSIFPSTIGIDINGKVRNVAEGGLVVGAEIERLVPLPWQSARIAVDLDARKIQGETIGIRIREVVEDYRFLREDTFREIALIEPLLRLASQQPDEKVVLWVDGLDEEIELQSKSGATATITSLLPNAAEACELGNLVVIASSRPGKHLDLLRHGNAVPIDLSESRFGDENKNTITHVIDQELADSDVTLQLEKANWDKSDLRNDLLVRGGDNFLYIRHFFLGIRNGETETLRSNSLPSSLDDLHVRIISQIVKSSGDVYSTELHPVVAMLAVAREPLHIDQLAQLTGLDRNTVKTGVTKLRPYLDATELTDTDHQARTCYTFFHNTFRDMLSAATHIDELWYVDSTAANGKIADQYLALEATGWDDLDDYARNFLTEHLQHATVEHKRRLVEMLDERWRRARRGHSPTNSAFVDDLARAFDCLDSLAPYEILPQAAKLSYIAARVQLVNRKLPDGTVAVMARLGQHVRAFEYVVPGETANWFIIRAAEMIRGLAAAPSPDWALIQQTRARALASMQDRPDHGNLSTLLEVCPLLDDPDSRSFLDDAIQQYNQAQVYWASPPALTHIGRLLSAFDKEKAVNVFAQCLDLIPQVSSSAINIYYAKLFDVWSEVDPNGSFQAASGMQWQADPHGVKALLLLYLNADLDDHDKALRHIVNQIDEVLIPMIDNPYKLALVELEVGAAEFEMGNHDAASARIATAVAAAEGIGGTNDPDNNLGNRPQMATEVWIHAASLATNVGFKDSGKLIERTWREALKHGIFNEQDGIRALIRTQYARSPELLEARLAGINNEEERAKFMIAAADLILEHDEQAASSLLDQAMLLMEQTTPTLGHEGDIALAVAVRMGREKGLDVLKNAGAQHYELDWHFSLFEAATPAGKTDEDWILKMLYIWSISIDNSTLERAAVFATLPDQIIQTIAERMEKLESPIHRLILSGALSARIALQDRKRSDEMLKSACNSMEEIFKNQHRLRKSETLALFAGAWWHVDREIAEGLWREALLHATTLAEANPRQLSFEIRLTIEALFLLAPEAILAPLLCHNEPPPDPSSFEFVLPGPNTLPLVAAGLHKTEILFSEVLADAMASLPSARARFECIDDPAIASVTASLAAKRNIDCDLEERMNWCEIALQRAEQVAEHHLRCLLCADAADSFRAIGLKSRALEVAESTAREIVDNGYAYGAILQVASYPNGLGRCLEILSDTVEPLEIAHWVWKARVLQTGLPIFLTYLPRLISEPDIEKSLNLMLSASKEGMNLFRPI